MKRRQSQIARSQRLSRTTTSPKKEPNAYWIAAYTAVVTAIIGAAIAWFTGALPGWFPKSNDDPHQFSISMGGTEVTGTSTNPFDSAPRYQARVELCDKYGLEGLVVQYACYLTIKPTENMTISNSKNVTTATYQDGSVATICCMSVANDNPSPLYRVTLPRGTEVRKTFRRGETVQIILNIPDADPGRVLDAITFSPGDGAAPILFPLRGNVRDRVFSKKFIEAHKDDPRLQKLMRDALDERNRLKSREGQNRGLTYPE